MTIKDIFGNTITQQAIIILMSAGVDFYGAFDINGNQKGYSGASSAELSNIYTSSTRNTQFTYSQKLAAGFDDIILYKSLDDMVIDNQSVGNIVMCDVKTVTMNGSSYTISPQTLPNGVWILTSSCITGNKITTGGVVYNPSATCLYNGVWGSIVNQCQ
jgi:hypothetical protein